MSDNAKTTAMRLVLAALNQDHDMRKRILHETDDPGELRSIANVLAHVAAKGMLDICGDDRDVAMQNLQRIMLRELD